MLLGSLRSDSPTEGTLTLSTTTDTVDGAEVTFALITPSIPPAVSSAWDWQDASAVWDLELARADGSRVIRLVEGAALLSGEVTTDA